MPSKVIYMSWLTTIYWLLPFLPYVALLVFFSSVVSLSVEVYRPELLALTQGLQLWSHGKKNAQKPLAGESISEYCERINYENSSNLFS